MTKGCPLIITVVMNKMCPLLITVRISHYWYSISTGYPYSVTLYFLCQEVHFLCSFWFGLFTISYLYFSVNYFVLFVLGSAFSLYFLIWIIHHQLLIFFFITLVQIGWFVWINASDTLSYMYTFLYRSIGCASYELHERVLYVTADTFVHSVTDYFW